MDVKSKGSIDDLTTKQACTYFRMGLVTGLVEIDSLVAWADRMILHTDEPDEIVIDLSLSGRLPHSRLIWLLSQFEETPDYDRPLTLLLGRAATILDEDPDRLEAVIMGLRLLNEEEYFPTAIGREIDGLRQKLENWRRSKISRQEVAAACARFFEPFTLRQPPARE